MNPFVDEVWHGEQLTAVVEVDEIRCPHTRGARRRDCNCFPAGGGNEIWVVSWDAQNEVVAKEKNGVENADLRDSCYERCAMEKGDFLE